MNTIRTYIAAGLIWVAAFVHRQAATDKVVAMGLGGTGPWKPGQ